MRPVRTLAPSTPGPDSAERELTDAFCRAGWLLVTVLDYYGCCFVLCGVILSSEPFPSSIIWALGCCLVGTPACAAWAVFRMVTAEPHPLLKRTGLELYSTVNAGGRMQRDSVFKSVSLPPLGWASGWGLGWASHKSEPRPRAPGLGPALAIPQPARSA